ncbi:hypothetical protein niasHS_016884 [Heterodera schachtii]|uniref:RING-type domain-containing protein n=1 Tax=Heterodera schachtii TaxID=97005 RepID=A0ABD2I2W8_HETSC
MHMIYEDRPNIADQESGRYSCILLWVDLRICDQNETNAMIKITKTGTDESKEFMIPKTFLSFGEVPIVLGFGTRPPAQKSFNLKNHFTWINNTQQFLGIKIGCNIGLDYYNNYVIGSAIFHPQQSNNANVINVTVPVYDINTVEHLCGRDGRSDIEIEIIQNGNVSRKYYVTKNIFIHKNPIEIDMDIIIHPMPRPNTNFGVGTSSNSSRPNTNVEAGTNSNSSRPNTNVEVGTSSNNSSIRPMSRPNTIVEVAMSSFSSRLEAFVANEWEIADKIIAARIEEVNRRITCIICMDKERNVVFTPCEHAVVCDLCAANIMNSSDAAVKKHCPLCRSKIVDTNKVYLS